MPPAPPPAGAWSCTATSTTEGALVAGADPMLSLDDCSSRADTRCRAVGCVGGCAAWGGPPSAPPAPDRAGSGQIGSERMVRCGKGSRGEGSRAVADRRPTSCFGTIGPGEGTRGGVCAFGEFATLIATLGVDDDRLALRKLDPRRPKRRRGVRASFEDCCCERRRAACMYRNDCRALCLRSRGALRLLLITCVG